VEKDEHYNENISNLNQPLGVNVVMSIAARTVDSINYSGRGSDSSVGSLEGYCNALSVQGKGCDRVIRSVFFEHK